MRRRILELLREGDASAGALVQLIGAQFGISQPATSQHLKALRASGLVTVNSAGRQRIYRLDRAGLAPITEWLTRFEVVPDQRFDALETELARGARDARDDRKAPGAGDGDHARGARGARQRPPA